MAEENQTVYDKARENYGLYATYMNAENTISKGGFVEDLPNLAARVAEEQGKAKGDEEEFTIGLAQDLRNSGNSHALSEFLKPGVNLFKTKYKTHIIGNLEELVNITHEKDKEKLQKTLLYVPPKFDAKGYGDIVELHSEANEMLGNLMTYSDERISQASRVEALKEIQEKATEYITELYKDDQPYLNALMNFIQIDKGKLLLAKYDNLAKKKTAEFNEKIKGKEVEYTKAVLDKKNVSEFYERVFMSDVRQESNDS